MEIATITSKNLTSECWEIQIWGMARCDICEFNGTDDCGGKSIIETGKNEKGISVPIS